MPAELVTYFHACGVVRGTRGSRSHVDWGMRASLQVLLYGAAVIVIVAAIVIGMFAVIAIETELVRRRASTWYDFRSVHLSFAANHGLDSELQEPDFGERYRSWMKAEGSFAVNNYSENMYLETHYLESYCILRSRQIQNTFTEND
eukprot:scaffold169333_cov52-Attheya_sp.AAC.2